MSDEEFAIRFPLFALKRGSGFVAYDMSLARPKGVGFGLLVFTTEAKARAYLSHSRDQAQVKSFDRASAFRHFLRSVPSPCRVVMFDLLPDASGRLGTNHVYSPVVVQERFLPEPGFCWSYPVYVLRYKEGFACLDGTNAGEPVKMLVVFTDTDLADRAVEAAPEQLAVLPIQNRRAFADLIRGLSPDVGGAIFDPPDPRRGGQVNRAFLRPRLIAHLEFEL